MAISIEPTAERLTLHSVPWGAYDAFLTALGDRRLRHTYDRGEFEMMSPSREHERIKKLIGRLIDTVSLELNVPIQSVGSSTLRREHVERGLEPDDAYYVAHERKCGVATRTTRTTTRRRIWSLKSTSRRLRCHACPSMPLWASPKSGAIAEEWFHSTFGKPTALTPNRSGAPPFRCCEPTTSDGF